MYMPNALLTWLTIVVKTSIALLVSTKDCQRSVHNLGNVDVAVLTSGGSIDRTSIASSSLR